MSGRLGRTARVRGFALALGVLVMQYGLPLAPDAMAAVDDAARRLEGQRFRTLMDEARFASAESLASAAVDGAAKGPGPCSPEMAQALEWRATARRATWQSGADLDSAITWARRALAVREVCVAGDTLGLVSTLLALGHALVDSMPVATRTPARRHFVRALDLCEQARGPEALECTEAMLAVGGRRRSTAGAPRAERRLLVERALGLRERALGPRHPEVAECLLALSQLVAEADTASDTEPALPLDVSLPMLQRARGILEAAYGPVHPAVARALLLEADARFLRRESSAGDSCLARAITILERHHGTGSRQVALALNTAGANHWQMGRYERGLAELARALRILDRLDAPWFYRVMLHENYSVVLGLSGDLVEGCAWAERTLALSERLPVPRPWYANQLGNLSFFSMMAGDPERAIQASRRAVAILDSLSLLDDPRFGSDLILVTLAAGDTTGTLAALDTMVAGFGRGEGRIDGYQELLIESQALGALGLLGRHERARAEYQRLDQGFQRSPVPGSPAHGQLLCDLAETCRLLDDLPAAERTGRRAVDMLDKAAGPGHPDAVRARLVLAGIRRQAGDPAAAFALALEAEAARREYVRAATRALPEAQALRFASARPDGLGLLLGIAAGGDSAWARPAWDALIRTRALVLDQVAGRWRQVLEISRCADAYRDANDRYAKLLLARPPVEALARYADDLEAARQARERTEGDLAQVCAVMRNERLLARAGYPEVDAALPAGSALVAYARVPMTQNLSGGALYEPFVRASSQESSAVYVALVRGERERPPQVIRLGRAATIDSLVGEWRRVAGAPPGTRRSAAVEARVRRAGEALRRAVWDPLSAGLTGTERVFVVPDGMLNLVNLAALPSSGDRYLVEEELRFHLLSAERDLIRLEDAQRIGRGLLAVGDPDVDAAAAPPGSAGATRSIGAIPASTGATGSAVPTREDCLGSRGRHWSRLPAAQREVDEVAALWRSAETLERLTGGAASEQQVRQSAPGRRVLHFATHGFVLPPGCATDPASIAGASRGPGGLGLLGSAGPPSDPFRLSGLVFAGANRPDAAASGGEDGVLLAQEIAALDLTGTEWAVLSACETGLGEVRAGEGVFGLRRAFQVAGVRTLIMSLWSVEDEATRAWMRELYRARLARGLDTAEAVRAASLAVLAERRAKGQSTHPFHWGAFVAAGDWR